HIPLCVASREDSRAPTTGRHDPPDFHEGARHGRPRRVHRPPAPGRPAHRPVRPASRRGQRRRRRARQPLPLRCHVRGAAQDRPQSRHRRAHSGVPGRARRAVDDLPRDSADGSVGGVRRSDRAATDGPERDLPRLLRPLRRGGDTAIPGRAPVRACGSRGDRSRATGRYRPPRGLSTEGRASCRPAPTPESKRPRSATPSPSRTPTSPTTTGTPWRGGTRAMTREAGPSTRYLNGSTPIMRMWPSAANRTTYLSPGSADTSGLNGSSCQAEVRRGPGKNLLPGALRTPCLWPHPPTTPRFYLISGTMDYLHRSQRV